MSQIKTILRHPNKSDYMVDKISQILYQHYKYKAFDMAYDFKQLHYKQCKNIDLDELRLYASRGLLMAIKNYNPEYPFPEPSGRSSIGRRWSLQWVPRRGLGS